MTNVEFYFDPTCPWCWITSRWLLLVSAERNISINWRPFSLALKTGSINPKENESSHAKDHRASLRILRLMVAARQAHDIPFIDSYTAFGIKKHAAGFEYDDEWIGVVLDELGLPSSLQAAADDTRYDDFLSEEITSASEVVGTDVGVPTIIFMTENGVRQGYFGPVLDKLPEKKEALAIWDGLEKLATTRSFFELKRSRGDTKPDTASTARC